MLALNNHLALATSRAALDVQNKVGSSLRTICGCPVLYGKHWNPKFRKERAKKIIKIPLPDYDEIRQRDKLSVEEMRSKLKEKGIVPRRKWTEKPMFLSCSGSIIESYVPPEGDGKISTVSGSRLKDKYDAFGKKGKSFMALRKVRDFEYDFDVPTMAQKALKIYIEAHEALSKKDEEKLHDLVTEKCFPEMMENVMNKTLRWKFIQSLEPPRVVHVRCQELIAKNNTFAQATVRFHTQQTLAVYDRFGRLMHGSEDTVKDVLEYVVYEKHMTNNYGLWRIHGKIIPDWMPPRSDIIKSFRKPEVPPEPEPKPEPRETAVEKEAFDSADRERHPTPAVS